jgi:hypothetical protein
MGLLLAPSGCPLWWTIPVCMYVHTELAYSLHIPFIPCLRILLAIYSEATACMRQLMCTAVSQLRSDQLVPLHHHAHFMYPACLFFLYTTYSYTVYRTC